MSRYPYDRCTATMVSGGRCTRKVKALGRCEKHQSVTAPAHRVTDGFPIRCGVGDHLYITTDWRLRGRTITCPDHEEAFQREAHRRGLHS